MSRVIRKITVDIATSLREGAGTRAPVFLGLGGREFRLDIDDHADFAQGDEDTYELGEGSNVLFPERNDPRRGLPITLDDVAHHAVYLRIEPKRESDDWHVANVRVRLVAGEEIVRYAALEGAQESLWLGSQSGTWLTLKRA